MDEVKLKLYDLVNLESEPLIEKYCFDLWWRDVE